MLCVVEEASEMSETGNVDLLFGPRLGCLILRKDGKQHRKG